MFESFNGSCLPTLKRRLEVTQAVVLMAQETGITDELHADVATWAGARGWHFLHTEAKPCRGGKTSCGAAVFARKEVGLRWPGTDQGSGELVRHRAVQVVVDLPGWPPLSCTSVYMVTGVGLNEENMGILKELGIALGGQGMHLVAADWNNEPQHIEATGLPARRQMCLMVPEQATCVTSTSSRRLDYFMACSQVATVTEEVVADMSSSVRPHRPVQLRLRRGATGIRQLVYRAPEKLPVTPVLGPMPQGHWGVPRELAEMAASEAKFSTLARVGKLPQIAWGHFVNEAELELEAATGQEVMRRGRRASLLTASWESVVFRKKTLTDQALRAQGWKWVYDMSAELARLASAQAEQPELASVYLQHRAAVGQEDVPGQGLDARLDRALVVLRVAAEEAPAQGVKPSQQWLGQVELFVDEIGLDVQENLEQADKEAREGWDAWQQQALRGSAKAMHRVTKLCEPWRPTLARFKGILTSCPRALLEEEVDKLAQCWKAADFPQEVVAPDRDSFPRATPEQIRAASRTFPEGTAQSLDRVHPRQLSMLSDEALKVLAAIYEAVESIGFFPAQLWWMMFPLLEKPKGGFRGVLLCAGPVRVWERLRRPELAAFTEMTRRPFWAFGAGRSAETAVWRQAVSAEAATSEGKCVAGLLWDGAKYYESFELELLKQRAYRAGIPPVIVKVTYNFWRGPRIVRLGQHHSPRVLYARRGLPAGDIFNDAFVKAYALEPFDWFVANNPKVTLDSYVDDDTVLCEGTEEEVVQTLVEAAHALHEVFQEHLGVGLALDKVASVSSSMRVARTLRSRLASLAGVPVPCVENLGVDFAPGRPRGSTGCGVKRRKRLARMRLRHRKLLRFQGMLPRQKGRMAKIYVAGVRPGAAYGCSVNGFSDAELTALRKVLLASQAPRHRGNSLTCRLALLGDPCWKEAVAPALQWVNQLWLAVTAPDAAVCRAAQLMQLWKDSAPEKATTWRASRGPLQRAVLSLRRVGWEVRTGAVWVDDRGLEVKLMEHSPSMIGFMLKQATQRAHERRAAALLGEGFRGDRACFDHVKRWSAASALRGDPQAQYLIKTAVCGGFWTRDRAAAAGYTTTTVCPRCEEQDSVHHRLWNCQCPEVNEARRAAARPHIIRKARSEPSNPKWTRLLFPHPSGVFPAPAKEGGEIFLAPDGSETSQDQLRPLSGMAVVDGSCTTHVIRELTRAAWAVSFTDEEGRCCTVMGPVWSSLPQTPQAAEHVAMAVLSQLAAGRTEVNSDCMNVVRTALEPRRAQLDPRKRYAGVRLAAMSEPGDALLAACRHVKAHRTEEQIEALPEEEKKVAKENAYIDAKAKEAVSKCHAAFDPWLCAELEADLKETRAAMRVVAAVMRLFSAEHLERPDQPQVRRRRAPRVQWHSWTRRDGQLLCANCLRWAEDDEAPSLPAWGCRGVPPRLEGLRRDDKGHHLRSMRIEKARGKTLVVFCVRCGAWATRKCVNLALPCVGMAVAGSAGRSALRRLADGQFPVKGKAAVCSTPDALPTNGGGVAERRTQFGVVPAQGSKLEAVLARIRARIAQQRSGQS